MVQGQELKLTTRSTEPNPTMCEVTWNTWWTCERNWCQCMGLHELKIFRFRSLSFCCQLVSLAQVFALFIVVFHAHGEWPLRPLHSLHLLSLHFSYFPALPAALHLLLPWCRGSQPCAFPLRSWATWPIRTPPQVLSPTTTSSRRLIPGVIDRTMVPWRLRLRWRHHRSDAP